MANMQAEELAKIFQSDFGQTIPLLEERCTAIRQAGKILSEKFDGSFYNCVLQCNQNAQSLLKLIVENFESFRDFANFKNQRVSLLKRAQILVSDIHGCLRSKANPAGDFNDIGSLTMFADYRVPQALAFLGVLKYSEKLLSILKINPFLKNGSEEEVVIRGNSIYACDKIAEEVERLRANHSTKSENNGSKMELRQLYPVDIDMYLWLYRRKHAEQVESKCHFIKTRSVMFKKFDAKEDVVGSQQLKQSVQKGIRQKLLENYPSLDSVIEDILPKKENFKQLKCKDHLEMVVDHEGIVHEYQRFLYPFIMHQQQVDKGAIKFVLNGSNIMSPGLTSAGGKLLENCEKGTMVAVMAEGKSMQWLLEL
uniref:Queuosine 5'-phosphate N-glycosylase/hydrolase n=1 Tax=Ditylenchus dipsaci TaxID=166011 RepID=A0A915DHA5_9BILA